MNSLKSISFKLVFFIFPIDLDIKNGSQIYKRKDEYFFSRNYKDFLLVSPPCLARSEHYISEKKVIIIQDLFENVHNIFEKTC